MQYYQQKYNLNDFSSYIWQFKNIFLSNELKKKSQRLIKYLDMNGKENYVTKLQAAANVVIGGNFRALNEML